MASGGRLHVRCELSVNQPRLCVPIVRLSMLVAAAARLAQAIVGMKKKMEGVTSQCKSWLVRDPSQQQPASQNKGLLASFCQQKPQNEIKIKINHKMS